MSWYEIAQRRLEDWGLGSQLCSRADSGKYGGPKDTCGLEQTMGWGLEGEEARDWGGPDTQCQIHGEGFGCSNK